MKARMETKTKGSDNADIARQVALIKICPLIGIAVMEALP